MNLIKEKKINKWIVIAALYVSFCFAEFMVSRSALALFAVNYGMPDFLNNDVVAFFLGGLIPLAVYELISSFAFRFMQARLGGAVDDMRYALRFFFVAANIVIGLIKLLYLAFPLISVYGNVFIDTFVTMIFFALYLWYVLKNHVEKTRWSGALFQLGGTFVIVFGVYAVLQLVMGVL